MSNKIVSRIYTKLGLMLTIADEKYLYLLEFVDRQGLEHTIEKLCITMNVDITEGLSYIIDQIEAEL